MRSLIIGAAAGLAAGLLGAAGASAATFTYSADFSAGVGAEWAISSPINNGDAGILGQLGDGNGSATLTRSSVGASAANAGTLTFDLLLFRTIDGLGSCCTDTFNLAVNGATILTGAFKFGTDGLTFNPNGATFSTPNFDTRSFVVPFTVAEGVNTFTFSYANLQSFGDEAWGLDNVSFSARVADPTDPGAIPEPATWAMMILGFGAVGSTIRRRRGLVAAA